MSKRKRARRPGARAGGAGAPAGGAPESARQEKRAAGGRLPFFLKPAALAAGAVIVLAAGGFFLLRRSGRVEVRSETGLNVLLVTLDTTRADRLGCYGCAAARTPNLDALSARGVRFAEAYAPVPLTLPSHATILTGTEPRVHGVRNNGSYVLAPGKTTLAEILRGRGYTTAGFVASFSVDSRFGLDQGFDVYDDNFQEGAPFKALNAERKAEQVYEVFAAWLDRAPKEPFLAWVHFFDPHAPYAPPSPYREEFAGRPYDGEVSYMDFLFGAVMKKIRERGLLGRTVIAVAADHGEGFGEKGESGHGVFLYDETVRVPLLLYAERRLPEGRVVSSRARLADLLPTILDLVAVPAPDGLDGTSLLEDIRRGKGPLRDVTLESLYPRENFGWAPLLGLVSGRWKLILAPRPELYDLAADPGEKKDLAAAEARTAGDLKGRLERLLASASGGPAGAARTLSADEEARLRSLGYVQYAEKNAAGPLADPKDRRAELGFVQEAERLEFAGDFAGAAVLHEKMLALRPGAASSYVNLALAEARLQRFDAAVATLRRGLERLPGSELLLTRLGYTYLVTGRTAEALEVMTEVLKLNPRSVDALTAAAAILDNSGRKDEARDAFERALSVEPENKFLRAGYAGNLATSGRLADAVRAYEALVKDYPKDIALWRSLGIAYGTGGDYDRAIESFKQITFIQPTADAYFNLALSYRQKGDAAEAVRYFELYLEKSDGEPDAKVRMARNELARLNALRRP